MQNIFDNRTAVLACFAGLADFSGNVTKGTERFEKKGRKTGRHVSAYNHCSCDREGIGCGYS